MFNLHVEPKMRMGEIVVALSFIASAAGLYATFYADLLVLKEGQRAQSAVNLEIKTDIRDLRVDVREINSALARRSREGQARGG